MQPSANGGATARGKCGWLFALVSKEVGARSCHQGIGETRDIGVLLIGLGKEIDGFQWFRDGLTTHAPGKPLDFSPKGHLCSPYGSTFCCWPQTKWKSYGATCCRCLFCFGCDQVRPSFFAGVFWFLAGGLKMVGVLFGTLKENHNTPSNLPFSRRAHRFGE